MGNASVKPTLIISLTLQVNLQQFMFPVTSLCSGGDQDRVVDLEDEEDEVEAALAAGSRRRRRQRLLIVKPPSPAHSLTPLDMSTTSTGAATPEESLEDVEREEYSPRPELQQPPTIATTETISTLSSPSSSESSATSSTVDMDVRIGGAGSRRRLVKRWVLLYYLYAS